MLEFGRLRLQEKLLHLEGGAILANIVQRSRETPFFAVFKTQLDKAWLTLYEVGDSPAPGSNLSQMALGGSFQPTLLTFCERHTVREARLDALRQQVEPYLQNCQMAQRRLNLLLSCGTFGITDLFLSRSFKYVLIFTKHSKWTIVIIIKPQL